MILFSLFAQIRLWAVSENEANEMLLTHSYERSLLGLDALIWDKKIALSAQKWADSLAKTGRFQHSDTKSRSGRGENLYMIQIDGRALESNGGDATLSWLGEESDYDYKSNTCKKWESLWSLYADRLAKYEKHWMWKIDSKRQ